MSTHRITYFMLSKMECYTGKTLSPGVLESADYVYEVSLDTTHAIEAISRMDLDVLIFADVMSEPMNHFLAHSRLANIQVILFYC